MKIIRLKAVNVKAIKSIEIEPSENLVLISGKNGQGKTSLMDCILYALAGKKAIPSKPIREGQEKAEIELDLGDMLVTRTFTEKGTYLKVTTKDGAEYMHAQSKLDEMVKSLYFDPLEFSNMTSKDQKQMLLDIMGVDVSNEESEIKTIFSERRDIGRDRIQVKGELEGIEKPDDKYFESKELSISEIVEEGQKLRAISDSIEDKKNDVQVLEKRKKELEKQVDECMGMIEDTSKVLKNLLKENPGIDKKLSELRETLSGAEDHNRNVRIAQQYLMTQKRFDDLSKQYESRTERMKAIEQAKIDKLSKAKLPIKGLSVGDEEVLYNDIPFDQLSKSEQIKVSVAIAMSNDTDLKLIRIMDGSLLDSDNLKTISDMIKDKNYQAFVEIVDNSGEVGFYIEEGELK